MAKHIFSIFLVVSLLTPFEGYTVEEDAMTITVKADGKTVAYQLNNSSAAKELYAQLPLSVKVEDFSTNEKIFYPPQKLDTSATPLAQSGKPGTLAYYDPWGDVVLFFAEFSPSPGLYELGKTLDGREHIHKLTGTISVEK